MEKLPISLQLITDYIDISYIRYLINLSFLIGFTYIFFLLIRFLFFVWRQCCRPFFQNAQGSLYRKYGVSDDRYSNSWAIVTGGSDGIGLAMCKQLAREGFNICIIARNEQKMKEKLKEI
jgi:hypothetical protein